jgi:hypothetical protein
VIEMIGNNQVLLFSNLSTKGSEGCWFSRSLKPDTQSFSYSIQDIRNCFNTIREIALYSICLLCIELVHCLVIDVAHVG